MDTMDETTSSLLFQRASRTMVGGVNSPVRAFRSVGGSPLFIKRGYGCRVVDVDDREYIDYVCSWGPLILGHAHPAVTDALVRVAKGGTSFGAPTENEILLAELICEAVPSIDRVRLVNSGTEATMSAVRLARAYTNRSKIVKFDGCYHGHADTFLIQAGSGATTLGIPDSPGVPESVVHDIVSLPYNSLDAVQRAFEEQGDEIAAVIVEPVAGNMGVVPPVEGFLEGLRSLCSTHGSLLIFDEVITGFRLGFGGAQQMYGVTPDITTLGKIIGGGLPVGAFGGREDIMNLLAPEGPVYQGGTLSGNPLAVTAGLATLAFLEDEQPYDLLLDRCTTLANGLKRVVNESGIAAHINQVGSMMTLFFSREPVKNYSTACTTDRSRYAEFFHAMLDNSVYLPPSPFESWFVSVAHKEEDIHFSLELFSDMVQKIS